MAAVSAAPSLSRRDSLLRALPGLGACFGLAAVAIAVASAWKQRDIPTDLVAIGEIGLAGELRRVRDIPQRLAEAARLGFRGAIVPLGNALIALTKNTTVAVVIGVMEMAAMLAKVTEDDPGLLNQAFSASALAFVALTLPTGLLVGYLGKKLAVKR